MDLLLKELLPPISCKTKKLRTEKEHGGRFGNGSHSVLEIFKQRVLVTTVNCKLIIRKLDELTRLANLVDVHIFECDCVTPINIGVKCYSTDSHCER
jgi:hypothetical protein